MERRPDPIVLISSVIPTLIAEAFGLFEAMEMPELMEEKESRGLELVF